MAYVGNLAWSVKWQDLKDHMKQAGTVEFCKILTVDGSDWGRSRGLGYVRYATEEEAKQAIATLNQTELAGRPITVDVWTGSKPRVGGPKGGGKGYSKGGGGKSFMPPFAKGWGKGWGKTVQVHGESSQMVYVANLPFKAEWQEVKDHMKAVGTVEFVKILTEDRIEYGRSKGIGCVRYTTEQEALNAVAMLNGSEMMGRKLTVDRWTKGTREAPADGAPQGSAQGLLQIDMPQIGMPQMGMPQMLPA